MHKLTINITIDMLLDGHLELVYIDGEGRQYSRTAWSIPNLSERRKCSQYNKWQQYYPIPKQTELKFAFDFSEEVTVDVDKSTISLGYTGERDDWVGPGCLFRYSLSRYISGPIKVSESNL